MNVLAWPLNVEHAAQARTIPVAEARLVLVPTDVMMPDGALVTVAVEGGQHGQSLCVTDNGTAARYVSEHGLELTPEAAEAIWRVASEWGLERRPRDEVAPGSGFRLVPGMPQVRTGSVPLSDLPWALTVVANACRDAAVAALRAARRRSKTDFHDAVALGLQRVFGGEALTRHGRLTGVSEKPHVFDWIARAKNGRLVAVDTVVPEPGSISAVVLRNLDVRRALHANLLQVIAYDDAEQWASEGLEQLRLAETEVVQGRSLDVSLPRLVPVAPQDGSSLEP
jgi:hypothetical protein